MYKKEGKSMYNFDETDKYELKETINDSLLNPMARQCKLDKSDFINLVDCPLSRDDYENKLINAGYIS